MGTSKKWLALTPEERAEKRKIYQAKYKNKYPDRIKESDQKYKKKNKDKLRKQSSEWQKEKGRINKLKAIEYLGGQCTDCKTSYPQYVYDFHHIDPTIKDFGIARIMQWENIILELDKCVLLCANCHRIRHNSNNF